MTSNFDEVDASDRTLNAKIAAAAKAEILSFLDGVLGTLSDSPTSDADLGATQARRVLRELRAEYQRRGDRRFLVHSRSSILSKAGISHDEARRGLERLKDRKHVEEPKKGQFKLTPDGVEFDDTNGSSNRAPDGFNDTPTSSRARQESMNSNPSQKNAPDRDPATAPAGSTSSPGLKNIPDKFSGLLAIAREGMKAVPATRYALGAAGIGASAALVLGIFAGRPLYAILGVTLGLAFAIIVLVFARLAKLNPKKFLLPAQLLMWVTTTLFSGSLILLFTSVFFDGPLPLRTRLFGRTAPPVASTVAPTSTASAGSTATQRSSPSLNPSRSFEGESPEPHDAPVEKAAVVDAGSRPPCKPGTAKSPPTITAYREANLQACRETLDRAGNVHSKDNVKPWHDGAIFKWNGGVGECTCDPPDTP